MTRGGTLVGRLHLNVYTGAFGTFIRG